MKSQRKIILLSGAGGTAFDGKTVEKYSANLSAVNGGNVFAIGDGINGIGENEIEQFQNELASTKPGQAVTIIIQSHGAMKDGQFSFCLGANDKRVTSKKLFDLINTATNGKPVDIFTEACHGGGAMRDIGALPKGSQFACLVDEKNPNVGINYHTMIDNLHKIDGELSAFNLLQFFTSNFLENRIAPAIGISGGKVCEPDGYLLGVSGVDNKTAAVNKSRGLEFDEIHMAKSPHESYTKIFNKIKNGELVYAKEYGTALSIILNSVKDDFTKPQPKTAETEKQI
jgi:hypothetical protein